MEAKKERKKYTYQKAKIGTIVRNYKIVERAGIYKAEKGHNIHLYLVECLICGARMEKRLFKCRTREYHIGCPAREIYRLQPKAIPEAAKENIELKRAYRLDRSKKGKKNNERK